MPTLPRTIKGPWLAGAIFFVILGLFCAAAYSIYESRKAVGEQAFKDRVTRIGSLIEFEISNTVRALAKIGAVVNLSDDFTGSEITSGFHAFIDQARILEWDPNLLTVGLALQYDRAVLDERAQMLDFEGKRRAMGYGPLKIFPKTERSTVLPLVAIAPASLRDEFTGFDLFSEDVRRETVFAARDTGQTQFSQRLDLLTQVPGILAFQPIYRGGSVPPTIDERREHFVGVVVAAYFSNSIIAKQFMELTFLGIDVEVHDLGFRKDIAERGAPDLSFQTVLASSKLTGVPFDGWSGRLLIDNIRTGFESIEFEAAGRVWRIVAQHRDVGLIAPALTELLVFLAFGLSFASLVAYFVFSKVKGADELSRRVDERTEELKQSNEALIKSRGQYIELVALTEWVNDGMVIVDQDQRIKWCNPSYCAAIGYTKDELIGRRPREFVIGPDTDLETSAKIQDAYREGRPIRVEVINYSRDGTPVWVDLSVSPILDENGELWRFGVIWRDISEQKQRERFLKEVLDNIDLGIMFMDPDHRVRLHNKAFGELFRIPPDFMDKHPTLAEVIDFNRHKGIYTVDNDDDEVWEAYLAQRTAEIAKGDYKSWEMVRGDGKILRFTCMPVGKRSMTTYLDITETKKQQSALEETADALRIANRKVERQATVDELTGVANRRSLSSFLEKLLADPSDPGTNVCMLHIDLDRFKEINDTLGHAAGDYVLCETAETIKRVIGDNAFLARIGGDEFVAVLTDFQSEEAIHKICKELLAETQRPLTYRGAICRFSASIGVAFWKEGVSAQDLLINSDLALYRAKNEGRSRYCTFTKELEASIIASRSLADDLLRGLEAGEFEPHYQPQYSSRDGRLAGVEALARWNHPERGILAPFHFLPVAEDLNVVSRIDEQILEKSVDLCVTCADRGFVIPKISVNVSFRRLADPELADKITRLPDIETPIAFELLESIYFDEDNEPFAWNIDKLRELGILIEIDDFGSGRASIIGLMKVNPDRMKIDRQLVGPIDTDPTQRMLVQSIVNIGHSLGIGVTAEGVENAEHARILTELGCDVLQGYHFAKPMAREDLLSMLLGQDAKRA
ncbi:MAG: EAL domain-containing protein [Pseudomonadota bacterium]